MKREQVSIEIVFKKHNKDCDGEVKRLGIKNPKRYWRYLPQFRVYVDPAQSKREMYETVVHELLHVVNDMFFRLFDDEMLVQFESEAVTKDTFWLRKEMRKGKVRKTMPEIRVALLPRKTRTKTKPKRRIR